MLLAFMVKPPPSRVHVVRWNSDASAVGPAPAHLLAPQEWPSACVRTKDEDRAAVLRSGARVKTRKEIPAALQGIHEGGANDDAETATWNDRPRGQDGGVRRMGGGMSTRVAVLGTGRMGSAIARRLAETGIEPVLWNRTRSRAEDVGAGTVMATPADAVARADVVIT